MPLLVEDRDITQGWIRERHILKKLYEQTFISRSHVFRQYVKGVARATELPEEIVIKSQPVRNFLKRMAG